MIAGMMRCSLRRCCRRRPGTRPGSGCIRRCWTRCCARPGVRLRAAGAQVLRARLQASGPGSVPLTAADGAGRPVITVQALALRPVTAGQLQTARSGAGQGLFSVDWTPIPLPAGPAAGTWAVIGPDPYQAAAGLAAAGLAAAGRDAAGYADLSALAAAIEAGAPVPDLVAITPGRDDLAASGVAGVAAGGERADAGERGDAGARAAAAAVRVLEAVQEWLAGPAGGGRLVVLTGDAVAVRPGDRVGGLADAAVWGLVRSAQAENPDRIILADLPPAGSMSAEMFRVLAAAAGSGEPEAAIRDGQAWGRRLSRPAPGLPVPDGEEWRLEASGGTIDGIGPVPHPLPAELATGEVRVAVRAAGLNFRDVLMSLGMYPGGGLIGSEIAGVVTETGPGVAYLRPGDRGRS